MPPVGLGLGCRCFRREKVILFKDYNIRVEFWWSFFLQVSLASIIMALCSLIMLISITVLMIIVAEVEQLILLYYYYLVILGVRRKRVIILSHILILNFETIK